MIQGHTTIETLVRINLPVPYAAWEVSKDRSRVVYCQRCSRPVNPCCYMYRARQTQAGLETFAMMCWQCKDVYECWLEHVWRKRQERATP
jgi:hypothetical protein